MPLLEPNYYGLWLGKQTAKGTPNTTPGQRPIVVGGGFGVARDDGQETYSDLTKYGAATDWVNSLTGSGAPVCEATPTELAYWLWLFHGGEAVSVVTGPPAGSKHTFTPTSSRGHYFTSFLRVGAQVMRRHQFNDCLVTRIALEASTGAKAMRVTPTLISLDPANIYAADPAAGLPADRPFLFTDASANAGAASDGAIIVDGTTFRGVSAWTFTVDDAWTPVYGDAAVPYDFVQGDATVGVTATMYFDAAGLAEWNLLTYGTSSPTAGAKPLRNVPALGSFSGLFRQRDNAGAFNGRELKAAIPGVKWTLPDAPDPAPDGGVTELTLSGQMRPVAGQQAYTIDVTTASGVVAFTT